MVFESFWSIKLLRKKTKTLGNLLLIILVVIPLVCCLVFVNSMIEGITEKYICLSGGHVCFEAVSDMAEPEDKRLSRVTSSYAVLYSKTNTSSVLVKGVDSGYFTEKRLSQIQISDLDEMAGTTGNLIMVSRTLADSLGVGVGDKVALMLLSNPDSSASGGFSAVVRPTMVQIAAIYSSGYSQLDDNMVFGAYEYFFNVIKPDTICLEMLNDENSPVSNLMVARRTMEENTGLLSYRIWDELNSSVYENFVNSRQMVLIIIIVIGFIACFYCGSIAQEMVQENFPSICIMRLLGATEKQIKRTIFFTVSILVSVGLLIGYALGLVLSFNLTPLIKYLASTGFSGFSMYLLDFPVRLDVPQLLIMAALILLTSSASVIMALRNERNLTPLQLLQN